MKTGLLTLLPFVGLCHGAATPKRQINDIWGKVSSLLQPFVGDASLDVTGPFAPVTNEILQDYLEPVNVSAANTLAPEKLLSDHRSNSYATAT